MENIFNFEHLKRGNVINLRENGKKSLYLIIAVRDGKVYGLKASFNLSKMKEDEFYCFRNSRANIDPICVDCRNIFEISKDNYLETLSTSTFIPTSLVKKVVRTNPNFKIMDEELLKLIKIDKASVVIYNDSYYLIIDKDDNNYIMNKLSKVDDEETLDKAILTIEGNKYKINSKSIKVSKGDIEVAILDGCDKQVDTKNNTNSKNDLKFGDVILLSNPRGKYIYITSNNSKIFYTTLNSLEIFLGIAGTEKKYLNDKIGTLSDDDKAKLASKIDRSMNKGFVTEEAKEQVNVLVKKYKKSN